MHSSGSTPRRRTSRQRCGTSSRGPAAGRRPGRHLQRLRVRADPAEDGPGDRRLLLRHQGRLDSRSCAWGKGSRPRRRACLRHGRYVFAVAHERRESACDRRHERVADDAHGPAHAELARRPAGACLAGVLRHHGRGRQGVGQRVLPGGGRARAPAARLRQRRDASHGRPRGRLAGDHPRGAHALRRRPRERPRHAVRRGIQRSPKSRS